jgi:hypothetical protein
VRAKPVAGKDKPEQALPEGTGTSRRRLPRGTDEDEKALPEGVEEVAAAAPQVTEAAPLAAKKQAAEAQPKTAQPVYSKPVSEWDILAEPEDTSKLYEQEGQSSMYAQSQIQESATSNKKAAAKGQRPMTKRESIQAARGKVCFWHNWRKAYGICATCRRPFCYEDSIEYSGSLYCLEDIRGAESNYVERAYIKYNNLSMFSAFLFMITFLLFVYFSNAQLINVVQQTMTSGTSALVTALGGEYGYVLWDFVIAAAGFLVGIMVVTQMRVGFVAGIFDGLLAMAIFAYSFFLTGTLYIGAMGAVYFVAMIVLAYSRVSYRTETSNMDYMSLATDMSLPTY